MPEFETWSDEELKRYVLGRSEISKPCQYMDGSTCWIRVNVDGEWCRIVLEAFAGSERECFVRLASTLHAIGR